MLPTNLNTNEVKSAAGVEVEFIRLETPPGRAVIFAKAGEAPNLLHRIKVQHQETGIGEDMVRRSVVRTDKDVTGVSGKKRTISEYTVTVVPVGDLAAYTDVQEVNANHISFIASRGATTTILLDGTGCGAEALINGSL